MHRNLFSEMKEMAKHPPYFIYCIAVTFLLQKHIVFDLQSRIFSVLVND